MKSAILGVVVLFACFLTILNAQIVPAQRNCVEGEPTLGQTQPDVNLTVSPSLTIAPLSSISVVCNAGPPRFPTSTATASNLPPTSIKIYIGSSQVLECTGTTTCTYNLPNYFPSLSRRISCTAANASGACRFKAANVRLTGDDTDDETDDETEDNTDTDSD